MFLHSTLNGFGWFSPFFPTLHTTSLWTWLSVPPATVAGELLWDKHLWRVFGGQTRCASPKLLIPTTFPNFSASLSCLHQLLSFHILTSLLVVRGFVLMGLFVWWAVVYNPQHLPYTHRPLEFLSCDVFPRYGVCFLLNYLYFIENCVVGVTYIF